jgi:predicted ribosome quality control (RQC) complex YloA/Tae2 family protein
VIVLGFGAEGTEWESSLVVELYDKGNVLLLDPSKSILTLLRNSKHDAASRLTTGDTYAMTARQEASRLDAQAIASAMRAAEPSTTARQLLMKLLPLGREAAEHALLTAQWPASAKMSAQPWEDKALLERLVSATDSAHDLLASVASTPGGIILLKPTGATDGSATAAAGGSSSSGSGGGGEAAGGGGASYDEFAPFEMAQHAGRSVKRFASFSEAVDDFFSLLEVQQAHAEHAAQEAAAWKKVDKIKSSQESLNLSPHPGP